MRPPIRFGSSPALVIPRKPVLENESIYTAWTRHCLLHAVEAGVNAPLTAGTLKRPLFSALNALESKEIASEMGLSKRRVALLQGRDISGQSQFVLYKSLRFCFKCLDLGYHSTVYQHVALARCPLHDLPLEDLCPCCQYPIIPTFLSSIHSPFECPNCETSLARTVPRPQDMQDALLADQMAGGRRGVLASSQDTARWDLHLHNAKEHIGMPCYALASRHYQRLCIWADRSNTHWMHFPEEPLHLVPSHTRGHATGADSLDLGLAAERVFIWLRQICHEHEFSAIRLAHRLGRYPRGLRINVHGSLVGAALYKLAAAYDLVQEMQTIFDADLRALDQAALATTGRKMVRYGASQPDEPELDFRLMQLEMLGMFAKFLVSLRHLDPMYTVSWLQLPHPIEFAPNWAAEKTSDGVCYRIRPRVTERTLQRLVSRKWHHELSYRHEDSKTPDEFWLHNQLDTVWSDRPRTPEMVMHCPLTPGRKFVDVPLRPIRPLSEVFSKDD